MLRTKLYKLKRSIRLRIKYLKDHIVHVKAFEKTLDNNDYPGRVGFIPDVSRLSDEVLALELLLKNEVVSVLYVEHNYLFNEFIKNICKASNEYDSRYIFSDEMYDNNEIDKNAYNNVINMLIPIVDLSRSCKVTETCMANILSINYGLSIKHTKKLLDSIIKNNKVIRACIPRKTVELDMYIDGYEALLYIDIIKLNDEINNELLKVLYFKVKKNMSYKVMNVIIPMSTTIEINKESVGGNDESY